MNPPSLKSSNISHNPKRILSSHTSSATLLYLCWSISLMSDSVTLSMLPCQCLVWPVPYSAHFGAASPPTKNMNYMIKRTMKMIHQQDIEIPKCSLFPLGFGTVFTRSYSNTAVISSSILIFVYKQQNYIID